MNESISKSKKFVFYGIMILLTMIVCLALLELFISTLFSGGESPAWSQFHYERGWSLRPGRYQVKALQRMSRFAITIDENGLRDLGYSLSASNRMKILILGDSFVFAKETRTENTFSYLLQEYLEKRFPGFFEVINAGIPAYGTGQELLLLQELRHKYKISPQVNVLVFFTNDILDNLCLSYGDLIRQPIRPKFVISKDGAAVLEALPDINAFGQDDDTLVARPKRRELKTIYLMKSLAETWIQTRPSMVQFLGKMGIKTEMARLPGLLNGWYRQEIVNEGVPLTAALIERIRDESRDAGALLLLAMVPSPIQVYSETYIPLLERAFKENMAVSEFSHDILRPQRLLEQISSRANIPFLDLFQICHENKKQKLFIPRDGHLTNAGHRLVAEKLFEFITNNVPLIKQTEGHLTSQRNHSD